MKDNRIFLIDGHGLCYRAFYAIKTLSNSKGQATNAVYGFAQILLNLIQQLKPTHLAVCFDMARKTKRQALYPEYKAQRQAMPDQLPGQIVIIRDMLQRFHIPIVENEGYEADDLMATLAQRFSSQGDVFIVTEDKDLGQVVRGSVRLYSPKAQQYLEKKQIVDKFGINPEQLVDYIALAGDASDNIPGVKGVGPTTAVKLLSDYGTIENIYSHLNEITSASLKTKLEASRDMAFLSKQLATVDEHVPLDLTLDDLVVQSPDKKGLVALFKDLEFKRLVAMFSDEIQLGATAETKQSDPAVRWVKIKQDHDEVLIVNHLKECLTHHELLTSSLEGKVFDVYIADYLLSHAKGQYEWENLIQSENGLEQLYVKQGALLREHGLWDLFERIEMPLALVLYRMEREGIRLDSSLLNELSSQCGTKMIDLEKQMISLAGCEFNVNSPKQLSHILFERLKLPVIKKTKTGFSTDEEVLNQLQHQHELPKLILEFRQLAKLKSTYLDALPALVSPETGRLHTTFQQLGAETGRLSSINPNLQNIPIRTDLGRQIRKAFVSHGENQLLLSADYSQIELRVLAHLANDPGLCQAFWQGEDIHRYTASLMFDCPLGDVDDRQRYAAKRVNFGIIYGISAFGLAKDLGVSQSQAQDFIDRYFLRYPMVRQFMDEQIAQASVQGYVTTMFGRRRYLPDIHNRNMALRQFAQRQAINTPVQGAAADMIKLAMVQIAEAIQQQSLKSTMILTVHDELVFNVFTDELSRLKEMIVKHMQGVISLRVPLIASVKCGANWLEMKTL